MFHRTLCAVFGERMIQFLRSIIPGGFTLLLFLNLSLWLKSMLVVTPQQHVRLLETFGRYTGYRSAGLSLKQPWPFQTARRPFSLQTKQIALQLGVKSKDNAFVTMPISLQYRVIPGAVKAAFYELHNPEEQIESYRSEEHTSELQSLMRTSYA